MASLTSILAAEYRRYAGKRTITSRSLGDTAQLGNDSVCCVTGSSHPRRS